MATNIDKFVEPSELGASAIPIGVCLPWMSPSLGAPEPTPPSGFEYCDGTAVTTVGSPILGATKPALMRTVAAPAATQRVLRGANTTAVYGGATALVTGGGDTHTHTGSTDVQGAHVHNMSSHTHSIAHTHTISSDGAHVHDAGAGGGTLTGGGAVFTNSTGSHNHSGVTGAASPATSGVPSSANTSSDGAHSHAPTINAGSTLPAYIELAWIIRVI